MARNKLCRLKSLTLSIDEHGALCYWLIFPRGFEVRRWKFVAGSSLLKGPCAAGCLSAVRHSPKITLTFAADKLAALR